MVRIISVAGARPNFMKIAPLMEAFAASEDAEGMLVHTGQHYDEKMSDLFFRQLGIPEPDVNLEVGSASHAAQTAEIMKRFEPVVLEHKPDAVLVVGDVNSTIACALVASKLGVKVVHVEAGLRSFDRTMPEEINRVLTDAISDFLFVTEPSGQENLRNEGVAKERIFLVGNVMIDTLLKCRERAEQSTILEDQGVCPREYVTLTMHRPANVDDPETLSRLLNALDTIQKEMPILFPAHPRTTKNIARFGFQDRVAGMENFRVLEPMGYLDFLKLNANARGVLTDSGGLQEETTALGVPCITMRDNTERPITYEVGTNQVVGTQPDAILAAWQRLKVGEFDNRDRPNLWDGHAAERIVRVLVDKLG